MVERSGFRRQYLQGSSLSSLFRVLGSNIFKDDVPFIGSCFQTLWLIGTSKTGLPTLGNHHADPYPAADSPQLAPLFVFARGRETQVPDR